MLILSGARNGRRLFNRSKLLNHLYHTIQHTEWHLSYQWQTGDTIWSLWQDFRGELWKCLGTSEQGSSLLIETILTLEDSYWHANGYQCKLKV